MPLWLLVLIILALDQGTKILVQRTMELGQSIPVISKVFHLTYILNPGAAFGMLANRTSFFIAATLLVIVIIIAYLRLVPKEKLWLRLGLGLLLGGALGNLIDRIRTGYVVDFFDFRIWPVFNVADIAISVGVGLLVLDIILARDQDQIG